jgi:hypothetical protein
VQSYGLRTLRAMVLYLSIHYFLFSTTSVLNELVLIFALTSNAKSCVVTNRLPDFTTLQIICRVGVETNNK